jgi:DNA-binding beta-propeller fold protein YncE
MKMKRKKANDVLIIASVSILLFSCKPKDNNIPTPSGNYVHGVWILDEGNYTYGNAALDFYHTDKDSLEHDVFYNTNKRPLGDVAQCIYHFNGQYYIVVNNSQKIEVADEKDLKTKTVIENLTSPRYFLPVNTKKAYVSDIYGRGISIIDLSAMKLSGHITYDPKPDSAWASWTEQMLLSGTNLYVTAVKTGKLLVINTASDLISDTINLSIGAKSIALDKENRIWVLCDGSLATPFTNSKLYCIDPSAKYKIVAQFTFPDKNTGTGSLKTNGSGDSLVFVSGSIFRMGIHEASLPGQPLIDGKNHNFYGLGVDPQNGNIYCGDALDFTQKGIVFKYRADGKLLKSFQAGVGPNGFLFVP